MNVLWWTRGQWLIAGAVVALLLTILGLVLTAAGSGHLIVRSEGVVEAEPQETAVHQVVIENDGDGPLHITSIALTPAGESAFRLQEGDRARCVIEIPSRETCPMAIQFSPPAAGTYQATLLVTAGDQEQAITLHGAGYLGPMLALAGDDGDFGSIREGQAVPPRTVIVSNGGDRPLTDLKVTLEGERQEFFRFESSCGGSLSPDEQCRIMVRFSGEEVGSHGARLVVAGGDSRQGLALSAVVVAGGSLDIAGPAPFTAQVMGTPSAEETVVLGNEGDDPVVVTRIAVRGEDAAAFLLGSQEDCEGELGPGSECAFSVQFQPTARRPHVAELVVEWDGLESVVPLSGVGIVEGFVAFEQFDGDFGTASVGSAVDATVVLRNAGDTELAGLRTDLLGDGFHRVETTCGDTLAPAVACNVVLRFEPLQPGLVEGALIVTADNRLPLTANGVLGVAQFAPVEPSDFLLYDFRIDLGDVVEGLEAEPKTITITNGGDGVVEIESLTLADETHFRLESDSCSSTPLQPGDTCRFDVVFAPQLSGDKTTFLEITYAVGGGPERGYVTGTGQPESG